MCYMNENNLLTEHVCVDDVGHDDAHRRGRLLALAGNNLAHCDPNNLISGEEFEYEFEHLRTDIHNIGISLN